MNGLGIGRLAVSTAVVFAAAVPAAHAAPLAGASRPQPTAPADGVELAIGGPTPTFAFARGPGGSNYGGQYTGRFDVYRIHVSRDPTILANGTIQTDVDSGYPTSQGPEGPWSWTPQRFSYLPSWLDTPGVYYWQVVRSDCYQDNDCNVEGPIRRLIITPATPVVPSTSSTTPAPTPPPTASAENVPDPSVAPPNPTLPTYADLTAEPISLKLGGIRSRIKFYVNPQTAPYDVKPRRFLALAIDGGQRWGATFAGISSRKGRHDGQNTIVFGTTPSRALGTTRWYSHHRLPHGERDIILNYNIHWHEDESPPPSRKFDVQTVLIHEFGHFVGNDHVSGYCRNNPMVQTSAPGDWWRSDSDWSRHGC